MIGDWFIKRKVKRHLSGCNFEMAKVILTKQFAGKVIPNELGRLLDAFMSNPGMDTALALLLYAPDLIAVFKLARSGGFTEHLFRKGDLK